MTLKTQYYCKWYYFCAVAPCLTGADFQSSNISVSLTESTCSKKCNTE